MPILSKRSESFTESVIRRMTRISDEHQAINLSQGFPDFDPPRALIDSLHRVADAGPHQYAVTWGDPISAMPLPKSMNTSPVRL